MFNCGAQFAGRRRQIEQDVKVVASGDFEEPYRHGVIGQALCVFKALTLEFSSFVLTPAYECRQAMAGLDEHRAYR